MSTSSDATEKLGELLGKLLSTPEVIELRSDLGGGKTTFVRGLARGFGSSDTMTSPTFTLNKIYKNKAGKEIHHFDFYRLSEPGVLEDQLKEALDNNGIITVIEWSDIVKDVLPKDHLSIEFNPVATDPDERQIIFYYHEPHIGLIKKLQSQWVEVEP